MVWKIHILTLLFLSPTSLHKPPDVTYMHKFMVVTMKKSGKLQLEYRVLLSFVIAQRGHNFRF